MRISTTQQFLNFQSGIQETQQRYLNIQKQLSSGKRISQVSDDPAGSTMVVSLNSLKAAAERYSKNLDYGKSFLKFTEAALSDAHDLVRTGYELAVRGANGATDQSGREGMIREIEEMQRRLVEYGNSQGPNGNYIFSGQMTDVKPFTYLLGIPGYNGDNNPLYVEHAAGESMQINTDAEDLFLDAYNRLESLKTNLQGGNTGAISGIDIAALQSSMEEFNFERGKIGSKLKSIEQYLGDHQRRIDEFTLNASQIEDIDVSQAIVDYRMAESAYQAALSVASNGFQLSILDYIR